MPNDSLNDLSREELIQRCHVSEDNMKKAATIGQDLLAQLSQERNERKRLLNELTEHQQMNHELRSQLEMKTVMERNAREELEAIQREYADTLSDIASEREEAKRCEALLRVELHGEMIKVEAAEAEAVVARAEAEKDVAKLRADLEELRQQLECSGPNSADSLNVSKISYDLAELREEKAALEQEVESLSARDRQLRSEVTSARAQLEEASEVLRVREEKILHLKEQLETLQAQNALLSSELDVERAGGGSRGNSLFSELEDRRVRAERCLAEQQEQNRILQERYRAKARELQDFKQDVYTKMAALRHQKKDDRAAAALCEAEQRCLKLEAQLREQRAEEDRRINALELELSQQQELAAAFGEGPEPSTTSEGIARFHKQRAETLTKTLEERVAEAWQLRRDRMEAIGNAESLRSELRESEHARMQLSMKLEGLQDELNLLRRGEKAPVTRANVSSLGADLSVGSVPPSPPEETEEEKSTQRRLKGLVLKTVNLESVDEPKSDSGEKVRFNVPEKENEDELKKKKMERKKAAQRALQAPKKVIREGQDGTTECKQM